MYNRSTNRTINRASVCYYKEDQLYIIIQILFLGLQKPVITNMKTREGRYGHAKFRVITLSGIPTDPNKVPFDQLKYRHVCSRGVASRIVRHCSDFTFIIMNNIQIKKICPPRIDSNIEDVCPVHGGSEFPRTWIVSVSIIGDNTREHQDVSRPVARITQQPDCEAHSCLRS